tara:strand:+ start:487 stop:693 length:207 start_codon:yes stop_codon:yes gene_type:complete
MGKLFQPILVGLGLLILLNLVFYSNVIAQSPCSEVKNTSRPLKFWSYEGDPVLKSKQLKADMLAMNDD